MKPNFGSSLYRKIEQEIKDWGIIKSPIRIVPAITPPMVPFQPHSETSKAAAESAKHEAVHAREQVLAEINRNGWYGCTDDELISRLPYGESARPRRIELVRAGLVVDGGTKRPTSKGRLATVWVGKEFTR